MQRHFASLLSAAALFFTIHGLQIDTVAGVASAGEPQVASRPRLWTDITGTKQVVATLIEVRGDSILLLKESGKYATPPIDRLSPADREIVRAFQRQAVATERSAEPFENIPLAGDEKTQLSEKTLLNVLWSKLPEIPIPGLGSLSLPGDSSAGKEMPTKLVHVVVSRQFFESYTPPDVQETRPVQNVIVGTLFNGTSSITGRNSLQFMPSNSAAEISLLFTGTSLCDSTGGDRVRIHSHSKTFIQASKRVLLSESGIKAMPTVTTAQSLTQVVGLSTDLPGLRGRIATRITQRRSDRTHEQANDESARRAEEATNREMDAQIDGQLAELNGAIQRFFEAERQNNLNLRMTATTSADTLRLVVFRETSSEPVAEPLPQPIPGKPHVGIWIHGSLIKRVLSDGQLREALQPFLNGLATGNGSEQQPVPATRPPNYRLGWSEDGQWVTIGVDLPAEIPASEGELQVRTPST